MKTIHGYKTSTITRLLYVLSIETAPSSIARIAKQRLLKAAIDAAKVSIFDHTVVAMAANDELVPEVRE